jgi:hypothetical protein
MPVILASQEAESRRIMVQSQSRQKVYYLFFTVYLAPGDPYPAEENVQNITKPEI